MESVALKAARSSTRGSGWAPSGPASPWECCAAQSHQARPVEAQEPSSGAGAELGRCPGRHFDHAAALKEEPPVRVAYTFLRPSDVTR